MPQVLAQATHTSGEAIFRCKPVAAVTIDDSSRPPCCNVCFSVISNVRRDTTCLDCQKIRYCSVACRHKDELHAMECLCLRSAEKKPTAYVQLAGRVLFACHLAPSLWSIVRKLCQHEEIQSKQKHIDRISHAIAAYVAPRLGTVSIHDVRDIWYRVHCCAHMIVDEEQVEIGMGLYLGNASELNHSCMPNCMVQFRGSELVLRSLCWIPSQAELTISYIDLLQDRKSRRKELQERYFFHCECQRCTNKGSEEHWTYDAFRCHPRTSGNKKRKPCKGLATPRTCRKCCKQQWTEDLERAGAQYKRAVSVEQWTEALSIHLQWMHPLAFDRARVGKQVMYDAIAEGEFQKALWAADSYLACLSYHLPLHHPELSHCHFAKARLTALLSTHHDPAEVEKLFAEASNHLNVTHGSPKESQLHARLLGRDESL
jgi:hypothetical protein